MTEGEYDDLFRSTYPKLVAMGLAMSAERHVAQELAQETLLRAHRHRDELAGYDAPIAWCRRVMGNLLIDHHRSRVAERSAVDRMEFRARTAPLSVAGGVDPAASAVATRWHELVESLTPQQRLIATLYYAEDLPVAAVADTMQIAVGTVKSGLSKARNHLRRTLGDADGQGVVS